MVIDKNLLEKKLEILKEYLAQIEEMDLQENSLVENLDIQQLRQALNIILLSKLVKHFVYFLPSRALKKHLLPTQNNLTKTSKV